MLIKINLFSLSEVDPTLQAGELLAVGALSKLRVISPDLLAQEAQDAMAPVFRMCA